MLVMELLRSCSHEKIAAAALASIGGRFALDVAEAAAEAGALPGAYAACCVRTFAREATAAEVAALSAAMTRDDQPILVGFQYILDQANRRAVARAARCCVVDAAACAGRAIGLPAGL